MNSSPTSPNLPGPAALAGTLLSTLQEEHTALVQLAAHFDAQFEAIRTRESEQLERATHRVAECMSDLVRLRHTRERQTQLLARVLKSDDTAIAPLAEKLRTQTETAQLAESLLQVRENVVTRARETQKKGQVLSFAIQYAASLGREMLHAIQGVQVPVSALVYTAAGSMAQATPRTSYVNQVG